MGEELTGAIARAGVVGAGGAGFPSHIKMTARAETVIVNGAECEPLLRVDQQLMSQRAQDLWRTLKTLVKATGAARGVIALKAKYTPAISELEKALEKQNKQKNLELFILDDFYPAGDEHVLVNCVTGRTVPEAGIPLKVGCIVTNVETLLNIGEALKGQPVVDTYLTITGEVKTPLTCRVPIGTPVQDVLALAGCHDMSGKAVIEGGPMMGRLLGSLQQPVTKTTKGLIVLPADHSLIARKTRSIEKEIKMSRVACVQCYRCSDVCPRRLLGHRLEPHKVMRSLAYLLNDAAAVKSSLLCSECGACEYACPMGLSPRRVNSLFKQQLAAQGIRYSGALPESTPLPEQTYRRIPVKRLVNFLGLERYNLAAPLQEVELRPSRVVILLKQHAGVPCQPLVSAGQEVKRGDLIGQVPEGALGAAVHASIDGRVSEVTAAHITIEASPGGENK
ncbi:4Fe-4S dicluster domain-containing protein [Desulfurispora thermophila]|uniref:4Fe-4S dicluster domain-containing protein n=1 Tax=Desulfurispora thermophila TaxID=265470 RepID=UPI00036A3F81|nr:4Fe-4S dicluster domain-containing protein [Desulfurispora thermophila]